MSRITLYLASLWWALAFASLPAAAASGPFPVDSSGYYQFVDRYEPLVATDRNVDLWAQVYRPAGRTLGPLPLVIFLHGNHGTCGHFVPALGVRVDDRSDYTRTGTCPPGYVVTPNHLGYAYMAEELASYGYVVVSINANRGITAGAPFPGDRGLNLMRGRLILRHLALLAGWNRGGGSLAPPPSLGFNPVGTLDFSQVGIMGHSRGGEGARAALQQFRDPGSPFPGLIGPIAIRSIFEIGPVDGQTSRVLDANGVNSIILLPACDGDVSNLQGIHVFDRTFLQTSKDDAVNLFHGTAEVWGADHNAYNTEWLVADSPGCAGVDPLFPQAGRSPPQQVTARDMLVPFFRATVGRFAIKDLAALFDPVNDMPHSIADITYVARSYLPSPPGTANVRLLETFSRETGTGDSGAPNTAVGVSVVQQAAAPEHYPGTRVAEVSWSSTSPANRYFQVNFGGSQNMLLSQAMSFRTALRCFGTICDKKASSAGELTYQVALVDANGQVSNPVSTRNFARISRPIGDLPTNLHSVLYTVEMPLYNFYGVSKTQVTGVRFIFNAAPQGIVDLADLALIQVDTLANKPVFEFPFALSAGLIKVNFATSAGASGSIALGNTVKVVPHVDAAQQGALGAANYVAPTTDIVMQSEQSFPITNAFPKVKIGGVTLEDGTVSADGKTLTLSLPTGVARQLPKGAPVSVTFQSSLPTWQFGPLP